MPSSSPVFAGSPVLFSVERYAVYDEFAAGGMATVHFARLLGAQGFRRTVAVKRLLPQLTRDPDFAGMLIEEALLAARVRHPNVVSTLDVVQSGGELLLVMDYVHGESLAALSRAAHARGEQVPRAIATAIVIDLLHGLQAAHEAKDERGTPLGLVHRDVSPQNVLVGLDGITRIADFGIAKASGRAHTTRDGVVKGKLAYMAPEQLSGGAVSARTDVFAAGAVLWELLTGTALFAGENHAETLFKLLSAPIPKPSTRDASVPAALEAIVLRALSREPSERFASAREMALALEAEAPSVRPSELAAWVERTAGERLVQRASILRAIEHGEPLATGPQRRAQTSAARALASESAVHARSRRGIQRGLIALVLFALAVLAWGTLRRTQAPARDLTVTTRQPIEEAAPARAAPALVEQERQPRVEPMFEAADAATGRVAVPDKRSRVRSGHKHARCDPPWSFDRAGRKIFKVECM